MQTTTAIGFLLFAGALFVLSTQPKWNHWHWERLLTAGLLVWGILNLIQHALGWNLGVDTLLGEPFVTDNSPAPGRMSLLTSLCFILGSISLVLCIVPGKSPRVEVGIVSLSCFLAGLSGSSLFCYIVDIPRVIWLGARLSEMAIHTAAGFFLLSIAIIMQRFRCGRALHGEAFRWMWAPAFFGTIFAIGSIFLGFHAQSRQRQIELAGLRANLLAGLLDLYNEKLTSALSQMAHHAGYLDSEQQRQWETDASAFFSHYSPAEYLRVEIPTKNIDWWAPESGAQRYNQWLNGEPQAQHLAPVTAVPEAITAGKICYTINEVDPSSATVSTIRLTAIVDQEQLVKDAIRPLEKLPRGLFHFKVSLLKQAWDSPRSPGEGIAYVSLSPHFAFEIYVDEDSVEVDQRLGIFFLLEGVCIAVIFAALVHLVYLNRHRYQELQQTQQELNRQKARLEAYVTHSPAAVAMFDRSMRYLAASNRWKQDYKLEGQDIIGSSHYDIFPEIGEEWKAIHSRCLEGEVAFSERDSWRPNGWGHDQYLRWEIRPWNDTDDSVGGIMIFTADITADVLREKELDQLRQRAESANQAKSNFLANMSHEIRTPMNSILGFSELLANEIQEPRHRQFVQSIRSSGKTLLGLINDLLDLAKIEADKIELVTKPVHLERQLDELKDVFHLQAATKGVLMIINIQEGLPSYLNLDGFRLQQVLLNLISNAIKFTDHGSITVKLGFEKKGDAYTLQFSVTDTGCGIPESFRERAFNKFEQAEGAAHGGTGLGLAICSKLVKLMGGRLDYKSTVGEGTSFFFTVPEIREAVVSVEAADGNEKDIARLEFPPATLLMVEDVAANRELMRAIFEQIPQLKTLEATGGAMGLKMAHTHHPDLILLDLSMPDMDGREVCQRLRNHADFSQTPIIAITASLQQDASTLLNYGFDECLIKPIPPNLLLRTCHRWLKGNIRPGTIAPFPQPSSSAQADMAAIPDELRQELLERVLRQKNALVISEIEQLAARIVETSACYGSPRLDELGKNLHEATQSFDISRIRQLLPAIADTLTR